MVQVVLEIVREDAIRALRKIKTENILHMMI